MNSISPILAVAAVCLILYRQMQPRPLRENPLKLPLILIVIGACDAYSFVHDGGHVGVGEGIAAALGLLIGVALAYPRATSTRVFPGPDGRYLRQGSAVTAALWVVAIGLHVLIDIVVPRLFGEHSGAFTGTTTLLYLGVVLGAQAWFLQRRVAGPADGSPDRARVE
ncbi:hypothetical protein [Tsukamurella soli]